MISLRNRAIAGAFVWASVVIALGSFVMGDYLRQQTTVWFDDQLAIQHSQAVVALANSQGSVASIRSQLGDASYVQPFSGRYWQIESETELLTSKSLTDSVLRANMPATADLSVGTIAGPAGQILRVATQVVTLQSGEPWTVQVAASTETLLQDQDDLSQRLGIGFVSMGLFGTFGAMVLVIATLRPLSQLREEVAKRWEANTRLNIEDYPVEVRPLVEDINALLSRNKDIVDRSNRQTADLAHALKTPAAIMRNELETLQHQGAAVGSSLAALDRLDGQLQRSLARMRAVRSGAVDHVGVDVTTPLARMARAFSGLAANRDRRLDSFVQDGLRAKIDIHDLDEICGNLLDNALKWSKDRVAFHAVTDDRGIVIGISDDGPGIPEEHRQAVLSGGIRLDETTPGTGLGLSIAADLVAAYGGQLMIGTAPKLGGAQITVHLPGTSAPAKAA